MRRRSIGWVAAVLTLGCEPSIPIDFPHAQEIPPDAAYIYVIDPSLLTYEFVDSTQEGGFVRLRWLQPDPVRPFSGYNCIALSPRTPTDTMTGRFVFVARGPNTGFLERETVEFTDTIAGYFLTGLDGSYGRYVRDGQGNLQLTWLNGEQHRYFDPSAAIRVQGNYIISDVLLTASADSVTERWGVAWVASSC